MQRVWLALALLGGCSTYFGDDGPDDPPSVPDARVTEPDAEIPQPPPGACAHDLSLALIDNEYLIQPITLDAAGTTLCMRLDTTHRTHPTYFGVQTSVEPGPPPSFGVAIHEVNGQLLSTFYPCVSSYAWAQYEVQVNAVFYVKVVAWSRGGPQATELQLHLTQIQD